MQDVVIGIDVACAKDKPLPVVICYQDGDTLRPLLLNSFAQQPPRGRGNPSTVSAETNQAYARETRHYIEEVCLQHHLNPVRIGIDSALRARPNHMHRRLAESALNASGISCYKTPSGEDFDRIIAKGQAHLAQGGAANRMPHAMQLFMLPGIAIAEEMAKVAPCLEIYPQAIARRLGSASLHKTKKGQSLVQLKAVSEHTGWPASETDWAELKHICRGALHDKVDAYSVAWVASLPESKREYFGDPQQDDAIWVPKLD
ncbi:DUF429 domain-containing protein, partial [Pseudidiomarina salinarum]|uniref:DUF429 domain-containing protein n=1 Tax=Pseudidiomarina salinarum TaxID=435908 RepID=UPI0005530222